MPIRSNEFGGTFIPYSSASRRDVSALRTAGVVPFTHSRGPYRGVPGFRKKVGTVAQVRAGIAYRTRPRYQGGRRIAGKTFKGITGLGMRRKRGKGVWDTIKKVAGFVAPIALPALAKFAAKAVFGLGHKRKRTGGALPWDTRGRGLKRAHYRKRGGLLTLPGGLLTLPGTFARY